MKLEKDTAIFVLLLVLALILFWNLSVVWGNTLSATTKADKATEENLEKKTSLELENESLSLLKIGDSTIEIDGLGVLSEADLSKLLTYNDIGISDIENIIIGDGISEMGYGTINGYNYLEMIMIGSGVTKIRNGSVRNCPNIKFVFLPSTLEKIARDFLYGTENCYIVSDGKISELIIESNVENASILEYIDYHEKMLDVSKEIIAPNAVYKWASFVNQQYILGTELFFNYADYNAQKYVQSGFSGQEELVTWTDGKVAELSFFIDCQKDLNLVIQCGTYGEKQTVLIYANDTLVEKAEYSGMDIHKIDIAKELICDDNHLDIRIELPDACSPAENGESEDPRVLGLSIKSIVID